MRKGYGMIGRMLGSALLALVVGPALSFAEIGCRPDQKLERAAVATDDTQMLSRAIEVRAINVTSGASACVWGLYDVTSVASVASGTTATIEPGAPAADTNLLPQSGFFEQPITFANGVYAVSNANCTFLALYECVQR